MYSSYSALMYLVITVVTLTLLTALAFSIIIFYKKRPLLEIAAWILSVVWLILFVFLRNWVLTKDSGLLPFYIYPILLTFFLLLQYKADSAEGDNISSFYAAKSTVLFIIYSRIETHVMTNLITAYENVSEIISVIMVVQLINIVIFWLIVTLVCASYLKRLNQQLATKDLFKQVIQFVLISLISCFIFNMAFDLIEHSARNSMQSVITGFNIEYSFTQIPITIVKIIFSSLAGIYIYQWRRKKAALN